MGARIEWLPIFTAPKDGREVLCYAPGNPRADGQDTDPVTKVDEWANRYNGWRKMRPRNPYTHWMPLPPPPPQGSE